MATFFNQATLTYQNTTTSSNIVTGELLEVLSVTKTAVPATYRPGDAITYLVSLVNAGPSPYTALTLTDDLAAVPFGEGTVTPLTYQEGTARYYVNGVLQPDPAVETEEGLVIGGLSVPAGGNALLVYSAVANGFASPAEGATLTNTVTARGSGVGTGVTASATVEALTEPRLSITKSISPDTVVSNGQLTYTFVIQNSGNAPAVATDDLTVTDLFDPPLALTAVTYNGTTLVEGADYVYDEATGLFQTVAGRLTVPAATFVLGEDGRYTFRPGIGVLTVTGTV